MTQAQTSQPATEYAEGQQAPSTDMTFWALMQGSVEFRHEIVQHEDRLLAFLDYPDIVATIEAAFPGDLTHEQAIDRVLKTAEGKRLYAQYMAGEGRSAMAANSIANGGVA